MQKGKDEDGHGDRQASAGGHDDPNSVRLEIPSAETWTGRHYINEEQDVH